MTSLESTYTLLGLVSFLVFLWDGRFVSLLGFLTIHSYVAARFRTIADRLLKLRLVPARRHVKRDVSYEFMNRQMVWHAFTVCQHVAVS